MRTMMATRRKRSNSLNKPGKTVLPMLMTTMAALVCTDPLLQH